MAPRQAAVKRSEIEDIEARLNKLEAMQSETNAMVREMHDGLMRPPLGHDKSLLDRMALTTIYLESGKRVGVVIVWLAGVVLAIGGIVTAFRFGSP